MISFGNTVEDIPVISKDKSDYCSLLPRLGLLITTKHTGVGSPVQGVTALSLQGAIYHTRNNRVFEDFCVLPS
jgi:hypothetical protein